MKFEQRSALANLAVAFGSMNKSMVICLVGQRSVVANFAIVYDVGQMSQADL